MTSDSHDDTLSGPGSCASTKPQEGLRHSAAIPIATELVLALAQCGEPDIAEGEDGSFGMEWGDHDNLVWADVEANGTITTLTKFGKLALTTQCSFSNVTDAANYLIAMLGILKAQGMAARRVETTGSTEGNSPVTEGHAPPPPVPYGRPRAELPPCPEGAG